MITTASISSACVEGKAGTASLPRMSTSADPIEKARKRFFHKDGVGGGARFWDAKNRSVVTAINVAGYLYDEGHRDADGKFVSAARVGSMHWHSVAPELSFQIDGPAMLMKNGIRSVNKWYDNGVSARKYAELSVEEIEANGKPFLDLLRLVLCKRESAYLDDEGRVEYFVGWLRYVLQNPGSKPPVAPYTYGGQGFFKGTVAKAIGKAFGDNSARLTASDREIVDKNSHELFQSKLVMVEEVRPSSHDGSEVYNQLKGVITGEKSFSSAKHQGFESRETPAALWLSSNHPPPFIEKGDRRFWVVEWECKALAELDREMPSDDPDWQQEWKHMVYREFTNWLEDDDGYAKLRALLEYVPADFKPKDAPCTPEKVLSLDLSESHLTRELNTWLDESEYLVFPAGSIAFELDLKNPSQEQHLAAEAGLTATSLKQLSAGKDPRITIDGTAMARGQSLLYIREGWELRKRGKWELSGPNGVQEVTADVFAPVGGKARFD